MQISLLSSFVSQALRSVVTTRQLAVDPALLNSSGFYGPTDWGHRQDSDNQGSSVHRVSASTRLSNGLDWRDTLLPRDFALYSIYLP